ncbi:hypothetical protein N7523_005587 [Penicillium sp. IBT 18751x]|nr:hypothetical protein N7523_005826 [Penicillium sp. IBT 18751x]KAJ6117836.1 hypothetical protein N7523_005587 [Penicillium sp. IBT 18751x]
MGTKAFCESLSRDARPSLRGSSSRSQTEWYSLPSSGLYSTAGFGVATEATGSGVSYIGNIGRPYGSNIIEVSSSDASQYKYVVKFMGPRKDNWKVVIWNKGGPDRGQDGWYNNACKSFTLSAGEVKYIAFDTDSQGGWAAAKGSTIPTDQYGGYASTWGEFAFGTGKNSWSAFDVSMIQAQNANLEVQGMKICSLLNDQVCSYITPGGTIVHNAYTNSEANLGGIGGNMPAGPVRLVVTIDYNG